MPTPTTILITALLTHPSAETELLYWDSLDADGNLVGGVLEVERVPTDGLLRGGFAGVETILDNGPSSNRIDVVFVGDGYLASELDDYDLHVDEAMNAFFSQEPLASYIGMFNVHVVDVVSAESGVDNDPNYGVERDTAMDMRFWCNNIERLLCVNVSKAYGFANNAPHVDQVFAVANSSMYGGAGYSSSELATYAGANSAAPELALHEWGHSLGNLADEYWYSDTTYTSGEPGACNASTYTASEMQALDTKWANWIGFSGGGWDGPVDTYEGCMYHAYGIYRPSPGSKMRYLGEPFNAPSVEGMLIEMYKMVNPIDSVSPEGPVLDGDELVELALVPTTGSMAFTITWLLDNAPIEGQTADSIDLAALGLPPGTHILGVSVRDETAWVRDEAARDVWMQDTRTWIIEIACPDPTGDGVINVNDVLAIIAAWNTDNAAADVDGNGSVGVGDLLIILESWGPCDAG